MDAIARWARQLGARVNVEKPVPEIGDGKRPDIEINFGGRRFILDVSITHPLADSYIKKAVKGCLAAAVAREQHKIKDYEKYINNFRANSTFHPAVIETFGGLGGKLAELNKIMVKASKASSGKWAHKSVVYGLQYEMAVAVARGNAGMIDRLLRSGVV